MFQNLSITNFRGIKKLEINDFKRINLLVGQNNSCKTTILEALFLLTGATNSAENITFFDNKQYKNKLIDVLKKVEPLISDLSFGRDKIVYCDIGLKNLIPINVLGNGLTKILAIILAIANIRRGIVLIDEIENGLYHSSQLILWDAIFEFAKEFDVQIFATTHSMDCIKTFCLSYTKQIEKDSIRLYRIEKKKDDLFNVVTYNSEILIESLNSGWEVR